MAQGTAHSVVDRLFRERGTGAAEEIPYTEDTLKNITYHF